MEGTNRLPIFNPTAIQRPGRVRTTPRESEYPPVRLKQTDSKPLCLDRERLPFKDVFHAANRKKFGQETPAFDI